ncbi:MAG: nucleoside triphosphate pyrophosphohydrolase [Planctomycetota bacterium]
MKKATHRKRPSRFDRLVGVMRTLRGPGGCPWDRVQTMRSIKPYLVEECYEVLEALEENNPVKLKEELGDLLFQIIFFAELASERMNFDIADVVAAARDKMTRRHPHVFGNARVRNAREVLKNWEHIKKGERGRMASVLDGVPRALPALLRARRVQEKASRVGFDWPDVRGPLLKLNEEVGELARARRGRRNAARIEEEMGDILFALVNVTRFLKINPEEALQGTVNKFMRRFRHVEHRAAARGVPLKNVTLAKMDRWWEEAKKKSASQRVGESGSRGV